MNMEPKPQGSSEFEFIAPPVDNPPETDDKEIGDLFRTYHVEIDASDNRSYLEIAKKLGMISADAVYRTRVVAGAIKNKLPGSHDKEVK